MPTASMILDGQDTIMESKTSKMGRPLHIHRAVDSRTGEISSYRIMFAKQSIYHSTHSCTGTCLFIPLISRFPLLNIHLLAVCSFSPGRFILGQLIGHCITLDIHAQQPRSILVQAFVNYLSVSSNPFYLGVSSSFSGFQLFLTVSRR